MVKVSPRLALVPSPLNADQCGWQALSFLVGSWEIVGCQEVFNLAIKAQAKLMG